MLRGDNGNLFTVLEDDKTCKKIKESNNVYLLTAMFTAKFLNPLFPQKLVPAKSLIINESAKLNFLIFCENSRKKKIPKI